MARVTRPSASLALNRGDEEVRNVVEAADRPIAVEDGLDRAPQQARGCAHGKDGFVQKPIGAGPYKLVSQEAGNKIEYEAFEDYYRPVHVKNFTMISVPEAATRVAMLERGEADIVYLVPGELIE